MKSAYEIEFDILPDTISCSTILKSVSSIVRAKIRELSTPDTFMLDTILQFQVIVL